jgi:site-specific DNA recombinase
MVDARKVQGAIAERVEKAVLYLRMSDERQEHSIPAQREELLRYAEKHGYQVLREYLDEAISGDDTRRRVGFLRMREDAQQGEFSVVLCWDQDRFGRFDPIEGGHWILPFRDAGVRLETIAQGKIDWNDFAGRLIYLVQQEGKHAYLRDLSRNVARGQLNAANNGRGGTGGRAPSGYKQRNGEILVDPEWAALVRRIFKEYLKAGASLRSVANLLNSEGVLTAKGNKWTSTAIRDILLNRKYTGTFVRFANRVGKYHAIQDGEIVERRKTDSPEKPEPMIREDNHEAIIDRRTFERAQAKLAKNQNRCAHRNGYQYIFTGLLRCGDCGGPMNGRPSHNGSGITRRRYECNAYHIKGASVCHANGIAEAPLMDLVVRKLQEHVLSEVAIEKLLTAYRKRLAARRKVVPVDDGRLRKQIANLSQQIDQGAERVFSAPAGIVGTLYAKLDRLRAERDRLQAQLDAAGQAEIGPAALDDEKVEEAARVLRDMREAFQDAEPEEIRELLSPLVAKVELHFDHERHGKLERNPFKHGTIFVRPTEPQLSLLLGSSEGSRSRSRPGQAVGRRG